MKNSLLYQLTLREALDGLRSNRFSAEEYVAELQRQIAERDGDIDVWAHYDPSQALGAARLSGMLSRRAAPRLPLGACLKCS